MDLQLKNRFESAWSRYFNRAELPLVFFYSREEKTELVKPGSTDRCLIGALREVRAGKSLRFNSASLGCPGGRKYLGFSDHIVPEFNYFLSCGIPGRVRGERYKKTPELVKTIYDNWPSFQAPAPFITFKRWDRLESADEPEVAIFFATPDVLAGLFTLANFDRGDPQGVITPMCSGCASIVNYPYREKEAAEPRAVIGMFDISARPPVEKDRLSFALPVSRLIALLDYLEESFLITESWQKVQARID